MRLVIKFKNDGSESISWMLGYLLHREDGPSYSIKKDGRYIIRLRHEFGIGVK
jgi:hypothetical protein